MQVNLVEHARRELQLCGQTAEDPEYAASIVRAVEAFASYGHSGGSAVVAREQLYALVGYEPLSPLTDAGSEWTDVSVMSGRPMWQNIRDSRAISEDGGKTYWLVTECSGSTETTPLHHSHPDRSHPLGG